MTRLRKLIACLGLMFCTCFPALGQEERVISIVDWIQTQPDLQTWNEYDTIPDPKVAGSVRLLQRMARDTDSFSQDMLGDLAEDGFRILDGIVILNGSLVAYPAGRKDAVYRVPPTITYIMNGAFEYCPHLENLIIHNHCYFQDFDASGITLFESPCLDIQNVYVNENHEELCDQDGVLFSKDRSALLVYPAKREDSAYRIPEGTKKVNRSAFCGNRYLTQIAFPASVEYIGAYSFSGTALQYVDLSKTKLLYIGDYAFDACHQLQDILLPDSLLFVGSYAFSQCDCLASDFWFPSGVRCIEYAVFHGSPVRYAHVPAAVDMLTDDFGWHSSFDDQDLVEQTVVRYFD